MLIGLVHEFRMPLSLEESCIYNGDLSQKIKDVPLSSYHL